MDGYLIWWVNQSDTARVEILDRHDMLTGWPDYLTRQLSSRSGRPGRGRLWIDRDFDVSDIEWRETEPLYKLAADAGGIVIRAEDLAHVTKLPGFVTDLGMTRLA